MPTPNAAFAAVAHALGDVDPSDDEAVTTFYRHRFTAYEAGVRALITDFLVGSDDMPSDGELTTLKSMVDGPVEDIPEPSAPAWDERYGAAMTYEVPGSVPGLRSRVEVGLDPVDPVSRAAHAS